MRANRMLYAPGLAPYDAASAPKATFVSFAKVPTPAPYGLVAVFHLLLVARLTELGLRSRREYRVLQGGWYRIMGISLPNGRFAFVQEFEHHPGEVDIHLSTWRDVHIHREDFFAAQHLLAVSTEKITLCDGPFLWR
jgi:hypothetical protein